MSSNPTIAHKELDLIQDVIKRQAANSFQVKTWMMGIVTAILAFKNEEIFSAGKTPGHHSIAISLVLLLPIICFWFLDGYFLQAERIYRKLYQWVVLNRSKTDLYLYDLQTLIRKNYVDTTKPDQNLKKEAKSIISAMFSITLFPFYFIPFALVIAIVLYNIYY